MENSLKPIKIKVYYDKGVKEVTKKDSEEIVVSEGLNFALCLHFIFSSYPEIQKEFPPGQLGFLLNSKEPKEYDVLEDGDEIKFIDYRS